MTAITPRRSALYLPGSNGRALEKARQVPCDAVIVDLEDAVAPERKAEARAQACAAIGRGGYGARETVIRINGLATPWGEEDLAAAAAAGPDAILIPKVSDPATLASVGSRLRHLNAPDRVRVWAMIETPKAILDARAIAAAAQDRETRLVCLVMGTNDLAKDTRAALLPGRAVLLPWLMTALAAARAAGIDILDGVHNGLADDEAFRAECRQGRDCGFDGKTLIHPDQIAAANAVFGPTDDEIAAARRIVAAFADPAHAGSGAIAIDGRMVERLHAQMAERVIALADAIAARPGAPVNP